jgi:hypothetical protein
MVLDGTRANAPRSGPRGTVARMRSTDLVERLCSASRRLLVDPYTVFDWPERVEIGRDWFMPPEWISLYGTPAWDALAETEQRRLSFYELVSLFSNIVAGERLLVHRMARYLYRDDYAAQTPYLHHFLEEENRHMVWFGTFCQRYAGKLYPSHHYPLPARRDPGEEDFRFWVSVLVFEELGDVQNATIAADERVHPLARAINREHHREESRHLAFGRAMTREVWARHAPGWSPAVTARVRAYVVDYLRSEFHDCFNPAAYADAGVPDAYAARTAALASDAARERFRRLTAGCADVLVDAGVLAEPPVLAPV